MKQKILIALDMANINQEMIRVAEEWGIKLEAHLNFLYISPHSIEPGEHARRKMQMIQELAQFNLTTPYEVIHRFGQPESDILGEAKRMRPNFIMLGSSQKSPIYKWFTEDVFKYVVRGSEWPLYIHRPQKLDVKNRIIVPIDYDPANEILITHAGKLAKAIGSEIRFVNMADQSHDLGRKQLEKYLSTHGVMPKYTIESEFDPSHRFEWVHNEIDAKLIMVAIQSYGFISNLFKRNFADFIIRNSRLPVLICK